MPFVVLIMLFSAAIAGGSAGGGGGGGGGAAASVSGAGGGGSSGGSSSSYTVTAAEANIYRTSEYNAQWGLEEIHAAEGYAALAKNGKAVGGNDVKIAITDTGIRSTHREIAANFDAADSWNYYYDNNDYSDIEGHGTHVASLAAGVKDGVGMQGVAFDAKIISSRIFNDSANSISIDAVSDAAAKGARVINASWKYGSYDSYNGGGSGEDANDATIINSFKAAKNLDSLIVVAAGNDGDNAHNGQASWQDHNYISNPKPSKPALFANNADLAGYVLAVGSVNSDGSISDFSNNCTVAKNYCLVAPGGFQIGSGNQVFGATNLGDAVYDSGQGTSYAAPQVSGAAAVLMAAWPALHANQVAQILLTTATDLGAVGVDDVYGRGLLNLYEAVKAQGNNVLGYGSSINDFSGSDVRKSSFISDPIFGDALLKNVAPKLENAVFFDDYGRDYKAFLENKISARTSYNIPTLDYLAFNNFNSRSIPLRFGAGKQSQLKFNFSEYKNGNEAANFYGLKYLVVDRAKDPQSGLGRGFSFVQNSLEIDRNLKFGFSFNVDEISVLEQDSFGNFGFISTNNFASNPYQYFLQGATANILNTKKFNQFFTKKDFYEGKFSARFSYQNSYNSNALLSGIGNKQNQNFDFTFGAKPNDGGKFLFSFGSLTEFNNNFLNSQSLGAFALGSNVKTSYFKIATSHAITKNLSILSSISEGVSTVAGNQYSVFQNFSNLRSRSSSLAVVYDNFYNGKVGFSYSEPMRLYSGKVNVKVPTAVAANGNISFYDTTASLVPHGKEQDFEVFYFRNLNKNSVLKFNLLMQKQAGNFKDAPNSYMLWCSFARGF